MPRLFLLLISSILFSLSSCVSHEELINFRTGKEKIPTLSQLPKQDIIGQADLKLQVNDVLAVIISSPDGVLATPYNLVPAQLAIQVVENTVPQNRVGSDLATPYFREGTPTPLTQKSSQIPKLF